MKELALSGGKFRLTRVNKKSRVEKCLVVAFWLWLTMIVAPFTGKLAVDVAQANAAVLRLDQTTLAANLRIMRRMERKLELMSAYVDVIIDEKRSAE